MLRNCVKQTATQDSNRRELTVTYIATNRVRQVYKNISMLFTFPVISDLLFSSCCFYCCSPYKNGNICIERVSVRGPTAVNTAVDTAVYGPYTAVYTCKRPCTRAVLVSALNRLPYRTCNFLANCCDYICKQKKALFCLSPQV